MRVADDLTLITDGPFVSVKEALGGWLTYEADDLDAAIELALADSGGRRVARSRSVRWRRSTSLLEGGSRGRVGAGLPT